MIINCYSQLSSLLPNEDDWSSPRSSGWLNPSLNQIFIQLSSYLCQINCRYPILTSVVRLSIGKKLNLVHCISIHRHAWWIKDIMEL